MCFSWGPFRRRAQDPPVGNSHSVPRSRLIFASNFLYVFLLGIFQATRPRSSGRELVPCAAFAINFRFGFFNVFLLASLRRRVQDPQVRNSYRVGRRVCAPKIPVFVSVNKFRTPLGVCRPVAIEYQTPLRISGTCFPRTAGEHRAWSLSWNAMVKGIRLNYLAHSWAKPSMRNE